MVGFSQSVTTMVCRKYVDNLRHYFIIQLTDGFCSFDFYIVYLFYPLQACPDIHWLWYRDDFYLIIEVVTPYCPEYKQNAKYLYSSINSLWPPTVQDDELQVKVNKLSSIKTQLPYDYYFLDYCKPEAIKNSAENLGEVLRGDRIENSVYNVRAWNLFFYT